MLDWSHIQYAQPLRILPPSSYGAANLCYIKVRFGLPVAGATGPP